MQLHRFPPYMGNSWIKLRGVDDAVCTTECSWLIVLPRFYNFVDDFFWGCVAQTHLEPRRYRRDHVPGLVTFFMF